MTSEALGPGSVLLILLSVRGIWLEEFGKRNLVSLDLNTVTESLLTTAGSNLICHLAAFV